MKKLSALAVVTAFGLAGSMSFQSQAAGFHTFQNEPARNSYIVIEDQEMDPSEFEDFFNRLCDDVRNSISNGCQTSSCPDSYVQSPDCNSVIPGIGNAGTNNGGTGTNCNKQDVSDTDTDVNGNQQNVPSCQNGGGTRKQDTSKENSAAQQNTSKGNSTVPQGTSKGDSTVQQDTSKGNSTVPQDTSKEDIKESTEKENGTDSTTKQSDKSCSVDDCIGSGCNQKNTGIYFGSTCNNQGITCGKSGLFCGNQLLSRVLSKLSCSYPAFGDILSRLNCGNAGGSYNDADTPNVNRPDTDSGNQDVDQNTDQDSNQNSNQNTDQNKPDLDEKQPGNDAVSGSMAEQVVALVNAERAKAGLNPVTIDKNIEAAASIRAKECTVSFSHTRPDGRKFSTVLSDSGISYRGCGENIAWGQSSPEAVMEAWMNSSGHRANILNPNYTKLGVGYYQDAAGRNYWSQLFVY